MDSHRLGCIAGNIQETGNHYGMKSPALLSILLINLLISLLLFSNSFAEDVSILKPASSAGKAFRFPIDAINPTPATNPKGATSPGYRGDNQLIIYTTLFGPSTNTSEYGKEAVVESSRVREGIDADNPIPAQGFVVSGHGTAAQWLRKFLKPGALATIDTDKRELIIQFTPEVYLYEVDVALKRAQLNQNSTNPEYQVYLRQAQTCRQDLVTLASNQAVTPDIITLAETCQKKANLAFYHTIEAQPTSFKGAWIRPNSADREEIRQTVQHLKQIHISDIFLETYFQGETIYPSQVMLEYGLPTQHLQYKGKDVLQLWLDTAHEQGLKLHAWTQVFFAGNEKENIEQFGPILQKYPEWCNVQRPHWDAKAPVISNVEPGHYFLDPANTQVREFLQKLILEIASYPIDGLNLDYIRYPASTPVSRPNYLATTWGYTKSARQQFQALIEKERKDTESKRLEQLKRQGKPSLPSEKPASKAPSTDPKDLTLSNPLWPRWVEWRKEQVSSFVRETSSKVHKLNPNLFISAVVFPHSDPTFAQKLQDYPRWVREGSIQALTPIGLSPNLTLMAQQSKEFKTLTQEKVPIYIGIFGMYNRATPVELASQINTVYQANLSGVILFEWSRLTPEYEEALLEGPFRQ